METAGKKTYLVLVVGLPYAFFVLGVGYIDVLRGVLAGFAVSFFTIGAGGWFVWVGFRRRKQRELVEDTPTEEVQSLSVGPSEITGTVVTKDRETITAPFTHEECVLAQYEIENARETVAADAETTQFYVDDGTGAVLVRPLRATFDLDPDDWRTFVVDSDTPLPPRIRQFMEEKRGLDPTAGRVGSAPLENDERRGRTYRQNLVRPGDEVYVFGTVHPRTDADPGASGPDRLVVRTVKERDDLPEPMFLVADRPRETLVGDRRWALWRLPAGLFLTILGVLMLVVTIVAVSF